MRKGMSKIVCFCQEKAKYKGLVVARPGIWPRRSSLQVASCASKWFSAWVFPGREAWLRFCRLGPPRACHPTRLERSGPSCVAGKGCSDPRWTEWWGTQRLRTRGLESFWPRPWIWSWWWGYVHGRWKVHPSCSLDRPNSQAPPIGNPSSDILRKRRLNSHSEFELRQLYSAWFCTIIHIFQTAQWPQTKTIHNK